MKNRLLLALGLMGNAAFAAVDMNIGQCTTGSDQPTVNYKNNTPDAWDMRKFLATINGKSMGADFPASGGGTTFVLPGASPVAPYYFSCGGQTGSFSNYQLDAKVGSCNEPDPPKTPTAEKCNEINTAATGFYDPKVCIQDDLGVNRGDGYGGFIDSYAGQTQIQVAIPTASWVKDGANVKFDPASMGGPFYMMSLVALQEYLDVDMQVMIALGADASDAALVDAATGTSLYKSPANTGTDVNEYGSFTVQYSTATKLIFDYPKYFPGVTSGSQDMHPWVSTGGTGVTAPNSPQQINSAFLGAMNMWWMFDILKAGQDLCFKQFLHDAKDKTGGLKLMLGGYFIGQNAPGIGSQPTTDFATQVLPTTNATLLGAADVTPYMHKFPYGGPAGANFDNQNYITHFFSTLNPLIAANKQSTACGGALPIYDAAITLQNVQELFFGQGGTAATQGNGGLLWNFKIDNTARTNLWNDLLCAFNALQGKSPSTSGQAAISYRYDFLTILRVARQYFDAAGYLHKPSSPPTPADNYSSAYAIWVNSHSKNPCTRSTQDTQWPTLVLAAGPLSKGDKVVTSASDDKGIKSYEYSSDNNWRAWIPTDANFTVPATLAATDKLWFRVTDSCGNSTIQEVSWKDAPPPPQLDKPTANPPGGPFYAPVTVTLNDAVAGTTIYYTTTGIPPTTSSPSVAGGGTITVSGNADVTVIAFATKTGYRQSDTAMWVFTKQTLPVTKAPYATPSGQNFTELDAPINVTLNPGEAGSVIHYTTDGSAPDSTSPVYNTAIAVPTTLPIGGKFTIRALATKTGQLASPEMSPAVFTKVAAPKVDIPKATPAGPAAFMQQPYGVALHVDTAGAAIYYSLNGAAYYPYAPISLTETTVLKAYATKAGYLTSDTLTVTYTYTPPLSVQKAWYQDLNGDGQIETVTLDFGKDLPVLPDKLEFKLVDQTGQTNDKTAQTSSSEIAFAQGTKSKVIVTFAQPMTYGATSVSNRNVTGMTFKQDAIPLVDGTFPVDDSVPPVVYTATVVAPDSANPLARIKITFSENVTLPLTSQQSVVFKRDSKEFATADVRIFKIEKVGDNVYEYYIDSNSTVFPIVGDSVAINPVNEVLDADKNTPAKKVFRKMDGIVPPPKPMSFYVTFPNSTKDKAAEGAEAQGDAVFIPIDGQGNPLAGSAADGKCSGQCYVKDNTNFVGPVFHILTSGPTKYTFKIFNNLGEFVTSGEGKVTEEDLPLLSKSNEGGPIKYVARVVWTGKNSKGNRAATGAYILQTVLTSDKDPKTGAPAASEMKRVVFGLLRSFRGS